MNLITLEEAMKVVENNESFYYKDEEFDGEKFRIFNYRLASFTDFSEDFKRLEMRGLCFNLDTGERWLGLHKFFNDNENPLTIDKELEKPWNDNDKLEIMEKLDGSLIVPTFSSKGNFLLRTKGSFYSEQADLANKFIKNNENYLNFIKACKLIGFIPFFELVGWKNLIVVNYEEEFELRLIQIRNKFTGEYLHYEDLKHFSKEFNLKLAKKYNYTLSELRKLLETKEGIEGWVVRNYNHPLKTSFRKFKTMWYFTLHKLLSPNELVENKLIEHIINETIDDILSNLKGEKHKIISELTNKVSHFYNHTYNKCLNLFKEKLNMERKEFAMKYNKYPYFGVIMKAKNENDLDKLLKEKIIKDNSKLTKAREFIKNLDN